MKNRPSALDSAKSLRVVFECRIPKTWSDYFSPGAVWESAHSFTLLIREQVKCGFEEASRAAAEVAPELFAEYWEALPTQPQ